MKNRFLFYLIFLSLGITIIAIITESIFAVNTYTLNRKLSLPNTSSYSEYLKSVKNPPLTGEILWVSPRLSAVLKSNESLNLTVHAKEEGFWNIALEYIILSEQALPPEVAIEINGSYQFLEAQSIPLIQYWKYETDNFPTNRYNDEMIPAQKIDKNSIIFTLEHPNGIYEHPLWFSMKKGINNVKITLLSGQIKLLRVYISRQKRYDNYKLTESRMSQLFQERRVVIIQCERPYLKSTASVNSTAVRDLNVTPYDTYRLLLNTFGGSKWIYPGQRVIYKFNIPKDGYYKVAIKYKQDFKPNASVFRKIKIDNSVTYEELKNVRFDYTTNWKIQNLKDSNNSVDIEFYLLQGEHTIELEPVAYVYEKVLVGLEEIMNYINDISLRVSYITGGKINKNIEWDVYDYFPNIREELLRLIQKIENYKKTIRNINKNNITQEYISLQVAQLILKRLADNPNKIPNKLETLRGSTGSVLSEISNAYNSLKQMPLIIDEIYIYNGPSLEKTIPSSFLKKFIEGLKRFVNSFKTKENKSNYNRKNLHTNDDIVLKIWVNRPRQYIDILQQLIDRDFTPKTNIKVELSIIRDEQKLILANAAKKSPDIALGISNWIPFEMGIRGAAFDLMRFQDFKEFIKNFYPGSLIPYFYENHCYGLPETVDFYVTFYRKDILNYLDIPLPNTWDDVKLILPELHRNGMNFYIPLGGSTSFKSWITTAPFILQYHGKLFSPDGLKTAIDTPETLKALREMTEFFTIYGMPVQVANFFESFRKGEIPLGIGNLTTYIQLTVAAPELSGRWGITYSPGVAYNNEIERWQTGSAQSVVIFNDTKYYMEAWEFLKWWLSSETQSNFVNQVVSTFGLEFLFIPSIKGAIEKLPLKFEDLAVILEQLKWLHEVPKMPASYVLEREISNIWNKVVLEGKNLRFVVDDSVNIINKEIARKLEEFGYYKNGKPIKPFKIYTLSDIVNIMQIKKVTEGVEQ